MRINKLNADRKKIIDSHNEEMRIKDQEQLEQRIRKQILEENKP